MKKFFPYILILILLFGTFAPSFVDAQTGIIPPASQNSMPATQASAQNNEGNFWSNLYKLLTPIDWLNGAVGWLAYEILIRVTTFILGLSGILLDQVIGQTIITMSAKINAMTGINTAWQITRDLMNIAFIFLLVYEGIKMIIGSGSTNEIKKLITGIVLAALLINFSLFFTKVLIDASNIVTIGLYRATIDDSIANVGGTGVGITQISGLSVPYMQSLGFTSIFSNASFNNVVGEDSSGTQMLIFSMMTGVLFLVTSFVFFAISIMFIIRYIVLIILMMLSPVAYMGIALPFMKPYANQWWESLKGQLLFAPIFMFMTLIILTLISSAGFVTGGNSGDWGNVINPTQGGAGGGAVGLLINFAVIIGLTIGSLIIAKQSATKGSDMIKTMTGKASAFAGGLVMGGAAVAGRRTVGRVGDAISNSETVKNWATSDNMLVRSAGKSALVAGNKAATSTFDVRGSSAYKSLESSTGMKGQFGKASDPKKQTYSALLKTKAEKQGEYAKLLKPSDNEYAKAKDADKKEKDRLKSEMDNAEAENKKAENNAKTERDKLTNIQNKISEQEAELKATLVKELQENIKAEINRLKNEEKTQKENVKVLDDLAKSRKEAFDSAKKAHDDYKDAEENKIKAIYENRANFYASTKDNTAMSRWTQSLLVGGFGEKWGTAMSDEINSRNRTVARKIRGVVKERPKVTKNALKELGIEVSDDAPSENKTEEKKPDEGGDKKEGGEGENKTS